MTVEAISNEHAIADFKGNDGILHLSNLRVWHSHDDGRASGATFLLLPAVDWAAIKRVHYPVLLLAAALLILLAFYLGISFHDDSSKFASAMLMVVGLIFVLLYFLTRRIVVAVGAGAQAISVGVTGGAAGLPPAARFVNAILGSSLDSRR